MVEQESDFNGILGEEYELFSLICPHHDVIQKGVGEMISSYYGLFPEEDKPDEINLLEIGSGTGVTTNSILDQVPNVKITSVDNSPVMIEKAKRNLGKYIDEGKVEIIESDVLEYLQSQENESFDCVASAWTLHNFEKDYRSKVLGQIYNVLGNKGFFVNGDKYASDNRENHLENFVWQVQKTVEGYSKVEKYELMAEHLKHYFRDNEPERLMMLSEQVNELHSLGFVPVRTSRRDKLEMLVWAVKQK
jgi:tRNA (cmo5U34)-methyltransferase